MPTSEHRTVSDRATGLRFDEKGIYELDSRGLERFGKRREFPSRLYILQSEPATLAQVRLFLSWWIEEDKGGTYRASSVTKGFWPLKYVKVVSDGEGNYYILNRYNKYVNWKKIVVKE